MLLASFHWDCPIHIIAGIDLQALLIRLDVKLDTRVVAGHCEDNQISGFWCGESWAVKDERVVIASAVEAALMCIGDIVSYLHGRSEVQERTVDNLETSCRYLNVVDFDSAGRIRHVQRVIENCRRLRVDEGTEVPVHVVG